MNVLLATPAPVVRDEDTHPNLLDSVQYNDGTQDWWTYLCTVDVTEQYPGSKLIGVWNTNGSIATIPSEDPGADSEYYPVDPDYENHIRQFGNQTVDQLDENGNVIDTLENVATDSLDFFHWAGNKQRELLTNEDEIVGEVVENSILPQYPLDDQPIILTMERFFRDDGPPPSEGWAWRATIEFSDPSRNPQSRRIDVYDENWDRIYPSGAFQRTPVAEDPDTGEIIEKWVAETPTNRQTDNPETLYYALKFQSQVEGRLVLAEGADRQQAYFWEHPQGSPPVTEPGAP